MISFENFEKDNGEIDWSAYQKAKENAGEICYKCESLIVPLKNSGKTLCYECKQIDEDIELMHSRYIRCPYCRKTFEPGDTENYSLYEDNEHEVYCIYCEEEFKITTYVSYEFTSPKMVKENDETDDGCNQKSDYEIQET